MPLAPTMDTAGLWIMLILPVNPYAKLSSIWLQDGLLEIR